MEKVRILLLFLVFSKLVPWIQANEKITTLLCFDEDFRVYNTKYSKVIIESENSESECIYFSFESKKNLREILKKSVLLKDAQISKVMIANFIADYWVVPKFALKEGGNNGIVLNWHKNDKIYALYLVVVGGNVNGSKKFKFIGCCEIMLPATNGDLPRIKIVGKKRSSRLPSSEGEASP